MRLSGVSGGVADILANDNARGASAVVDILATDKAFTSQRCGRWVPATAPVARSPSADFGDGSCIVGVDIAPGTWRTPGTDGCYWARTSTLGGSARSILTNDNARGAAVVQIAASDVGFTATRCGTWSMVKIKPVGSASKSLTTELIHYPHASEPIESVMIPDASACVRLTAAECRGRAERDQHGLERHPGAGSLPSGSG